MIYRATASRLCRGAAWQALKSPAPPRPAAPPRGPRFVSCNPAQGQCVGYETMLNCSQTEIGGAPRLALLSAVRSPPFLRQDTWNLVGRARPGIVAPFSVRRFSGDSEKKEEGGGGRDVDPVELLQAIESCERVNDMLRLWAGYCPPLSRLNHGARANFPATWEFRKPGFPTSLDLAGSHDQPS